MPPPHDSHLTITYSIQTTSSQHTNRISSSSLNTSKEYNLLYLDDIFINKARNHPLSTRAFQPAKITISAIMQIRRKFHLLQLIDWEIQISASGYVNLSKSGNTCAITFASNIL